MLKSIPQFIIFTSAIVSAAVSFGADQPSFFDRSRGDLPMSHTGFQTAVLSLVDEDSQARASEGKGRSAFGQQNVVVPPRSTQVTSPIPQVPTGPSSAAGKAPPFELSSSQARTGATQQSPATPERLTPSPKPPLSPGSQLLRSLSPQLLSLSHSSSASDLSSALSSSTLSTTLSQSSIVVVRSFFLYCDTAALSNEYLANPNAPVYAKQPEIRLVLKIPRSMKDWFYESQALWNEYKIAKDRQATKEKMLREFQESPAADPLLQPESPASQPPSKPQSSLLSTITLVSYRSTQTPAQQLEYRRQRADEAAQDARKVLAKAKARHCGLSEEQIETLAYKPPLSLSEKKTVERESTPSARAFEITSERDLAIELLMLEGSNDTQPYPGRLARMESFLKALEDVQTAYQRDVVGRTQGWSSEKIRDWLNLKGKDGPLDIVITQLQKKYPFVSPAHHQYTDTSTYKGFVLRMLNLDSLGEALRNAYLKHITKFKDPFYVGLKEEDQPRAALALHNLNAQYRDLPKHFDTNGLALPSEVIAPIRDLTDKSLFQRAYEGVDKKVTTSQQFANTKVSFYMINERYYIKNDQLTRFIPVRSDMLASNPRLETEYNNITEYLQFETDKAADDPVLKPNPLVKRLADMPKKFARMVRDFPTFAALSYHRQRWIEVLIELHKKKSPILVGYGEGLIKPEEDLPEMTAVRRQLNPILVSRHNIATRSYKEKSEMARDRIKDLSASPGMFSSLPYASEFIVFTKPEQPKQQLPLELMDTQDPKYAVILDLSNRGIVDAHLEAMYRTPMGVTKGLFSGCTDLDLNRNELTNPKGGLDFRQLKVLRACNNKLVNLAFLEHLWGQLLVCHASHNQLTQVPNCGSVTNPPLFDINLAGNSINTLVGIERFPNLKAIDISNNFIRTLQPLASLPCLESLVADSCGLIGKWADVLPSMRILTVLSVKSNKNLAFLPYKQSSSYSRRDEENNNRRFNEAFPSLEKLAATVDNRDKVLNAEKLSSNLLDTSEASSPTSKIIKTINVSDLSPHFN